MNNEIWNGWMGDGDDDGDDDLIVRKNGDVHLGLCRWSRPLTWAGEAEGGGVISGIKLCSWCFS